MSVQSKDRAGAANIFVCVAAFLFNGMLALSIGALLPYVRDSYGLNYAFAGLLVSLHSVGNLAACFLCGVVQMALGRRRTMLLFTLCYAGSFALILASPQPAALAAAFTMTGLARGAGTNFSNTEAVFVAPDSSWVSNALQACFALGALAAPLLMLLCIRFGTWRWMCWLMVALGLLALLMYAVMPITTDRMTNDDSPAAVRSYAFLKLPDFWLTMGTLFFYLCAEQGVIGWMVTYFQDTGIMSAGYAQTMASVLWVVILFGRLTSAWLCTRMRPSRLMVGMGLGMTVFFLVLLWGRTLPVITVGIVGFGFSMAGVYPTRVSMAGELMRIHPLSWSFILTGGSLGGIVMPAVIGAVAEKAGIAMGISTLLLAVLATLTMTLLTVLSEKRARR